MFSSSSPHGGVLTPPPLAVPGFRTVAEISLDVDGDARTVLAGIEEISRTDNLRLQVPMPSCACPRPLGRPPASMPPLCLIAAHCDLYLFPTQVYKDIYEGEDMPASTGPADVFAHALARAIRNTRRQSPSVRS